MQIDTSGKWVYLGNMNNREGNDCYVFQNIDTFEIIYLTMHTFRELMRSSDKLDIINSVDMIGTKSNFQKEVNKFNLDYNMSDAYKERTTAIEKFVDRFVYDLIQFRHNPNIKKTMHVTNIDTSGDVNTFNLVVNAPKYKLNNTLLQVRFRKVICRKSKNRADDLQRFGIALCLTAIKYEDITAVLYQSPELRTPDMTGNETSIEIDSIIAITEEKLATYLLEQCKKFIDNDFTEIIPKVKIKNKSVLSNITKDSSLDSIPVDKRFFEDSRNTQDYKNYIQMYNMNKIADTLSQETIHSRNSLSASDLDELKQMEENNKRCKKYTDESKETRKTRKTPIEKILDIQKKLDKLRGTRK